MVEIPFRERAAVAAKLSDGTSESRCGPKIGKLPKANRQRYGTREEASLVTCALPAQRWWRSLRKAKAVSGKSVPSRITCPQGTPGFDTLRHSSRL